MSIKNLLYNQLRDLHQAEITIIPLLQNHARTAHHYPRIGRHLKNLLKESQLRSNKIQTYMQHIKQSNKGVLKKISALQ